MNARDARNEGLVEVQSLNFPKFRVRDKEELKEVIKLYRKKYNVRIVLTSTQTGSGYHRSFTHRAYAEPILIDYLVLEQEEAEKKKLEDERIKIETEYRLKLKDLEEKEINFFNKINAARNNVNEREKIG